MFDRRLIENFDWGFIILILLIGSVGLVILYSALTAGGHDPGTIHILFKKQMIWMGSGFVIMIITLMIDFRELDKLNLLIYALCIGLLISVLVFGHLGGGSRRWLVLGFVRIQPSELMKIALIISLSSVYSTAVSQTGLNFRKLIKPAVLCIIPFVLIVDQPDLGTGLLLLLIAGTITLFVKVERKVFFSFFAICLAAVPLVWITLKEYQKFRILTFLDPDRDPLGAGYHIIQSKIAIGSGMLTGKGFLKGTQNALSFLPEQHTDFIVSVLAEEWGLVGCSILLVLYFFLLFWGLNIAYNCRNMFGSILAFGVTAMIFWQIFINIGMVMGLMPVVGVPLPLVSYGGSSVVTNMVGFGILLNISMRKFSSN
ncbi:MAG: rod shape-determining protein RodA [Proteobacteria bacterium]|nr:rod shape-determining protein RodA [Pseudomonadota bacterium]MBU1583435.1 rod shape-determining protein RodA [Pseudomonadota bacterium]MBU2452117.1 rod shape-determining protein RodA [Pseudomonadota bacterium]